MEQPIRDPEELSLVRKLLPYSRDQALELSKEVVKLLSRDTAVKEEFDVDEEPVPSKKSGVESWLSAVTEKPALSSWMKVSFELSGCLVRKVNAEVRFASKKGFATQLPTDPTPGWVLEQAIVTRKETENACNGLNATMQLDPTSDDFLLLLAERLDYATSSLCRARNALLFPNPLGFPRALRPFNGFSPPLATEYLLDFSIFRDRLVVAAFRLAHQPGNGQPTYQAIVPDRWFDDPAPPAPSRLVGTTVVIEGGSTVRILEHHSTSFQVALLTKIQVFLGDAHRVLRDLSLNVVALLSVRPDFYLSTVRRKVYSAEDGDDGEPELPLIQPSRSEHPAPGKRWV